MKIPQNAVRHELKSSILWISEEGIVYTTQKPDAKPQQSKEEIIEVMEQFRAITGDKKVCLVMESNNSTPPSKEVRDLIAAELNRVTKAMAIVTNSPMSKMIANLFFGLKPPSYPAKMFTRQDEAEQWIRQYL